MGRGWRWRWRIGFEGWVPGLLGLELMIGLR